MKIVTLKSFSIAFLMSLIFVACKEDEKEENVISNEYHAHIHQPSTDDKMIGDTLNMHIMFEDHLGGDLENFSVEIKSVDGDSVLYSKPDVMPDLETEEYVFHDELILSMENGFVGHTNYLLTAKVWANGAENSAVSETVLFHVHPNMGGGMH